jgi:hypothetical protein
MFPQFGPACSCRVMVWGHNHALHRRRLPSIVFHGFLSFLWRFSQSPPAPLLFIQPVVAPSDPLVIVFQEWSGRRTRSLNTLAVAGSQETNNKYCVIGVALIAGGAKIFGARRGLKALHTLRDYSARGPIRRFGRKPACPTWRNRHQAARVFEYVRLRPGAVKNI